MKSLTIQNADTVKPEAISRKVTRSEPRTKEEGGGRSRVITPEGEKLRFRKANATENKTQLPAPWQLGGWGPAIVITVDYRTSRAG